MVVSGGTCHHTKGASLTCFTWRVRPTGIQHSVIQWLSTDISKQHATATQTTTIWPISAVETSEIVLKVSSLLFQHWDPDITRAVSSRFSTVSAQVRSQVRSCGGYLVEKVALGQTVSGYFGFRWISRSSKCSIFINRGSYNRRNSGRCRGTR
jgi:hypothetical protein